ncbi:MAG: hypothetical protein N4A64_12065 [Marinisporobacter sp.]|jgi:hypothetical protein|nr:hypothetical protein [Marinisporobacter sp.]
MEEDKNKKQSSEKNVIEKIKKPMLNTFISSILESYQTNGIKEYPAED